MINNIKKIILYKNEVIINLINRKICKLLEINNDLNLKSKFIILILI